MAAFLIFALVFAVAALPLAPAADVESGKKQYQRHCAMCHGATGEPNQNIVKRLGVEMRHLGSKEVQAKTDDELRKVLSEGSGKMKPVKLTDEETADVIAFVRTLKTGGAEKK